MSFKSGAAVLGLTSLVLALTAAAPRPALSADVPASPNGVYIVMLKDKPVVTYEGGVAGLPRTAVDSTARIDKSAPDVRRYVGHLAAHKSEILARVGGAVKVQDYSYAAAGVAARLTRGQAAALAESPDVLFVAPDLRRTAADYQTPSFLGLTGSNGLWSRLGGPAKAGEGVIIGDIDSGITPESPVFAALPPSTVDADVARRWRGSCVAGTTGPAVVCNNKLIGAKVFGPGGVDAVPDEFFGSPRDYDGHGTHTASTAAGNHGVPMTVDGKDFGKFSGMAPAARIAAYKALWHKADNTTSGDDSDITKAIDEAVADGVDVINFSITGSTTSEDDPTAYAFYNAAKAGVFVAAAAANDGPGVSTVQNNYPWVTTVGAGTDDVVHHATLGLGDGTNEVGVGVGDAVPAAPLVVSTSAGLPGADAVKTAQCYSKSWDPASPRGFLDPAKVAGKIVVCDRGVNDRVDKSKAVHEAGGVGMVLVNPTPNTFNADLHAVPTVHVDATAGARVKAYAGTANPTAALSGSRADRATGPKVASFSGRGPALATGGDLLKPDLIAPGVDMLAAVSPSNHQGRGFDFESGTSMATPHIAGLAALILQRHPRWSPMAVKSALMTTADPLDNDRAPIRTDDGALATPFDRGAGLVDPSAAADAGPVYDSTARDWDRFLCGQGSLPPSGECHGVIDASELNVPSLAIGELSGTKRITRTLTNSGDRIWAGYAVVRAPAGITVRVDPPVLVLPPGTSRTFSVEFSRTTAGSGQFVFGELSWEGTGKAVRSPIAIRPR
ncbi:S8 family serine peptidase [Amycolatopsis japonica]|uniref:S8 family serine peptidase n=1 Tax=Amycolatopsis japonica TaxID=208439 RepID=UPI0037B4DBE3